MCRILIAAHETNYHAKHLVSLFNEVRNTDAKMAEPGSDRLNHAIAIAEQVTYSEDARMDALRGTSVRGGRSGSSIRHQDGTAWNNHDQTCSLETIEEPNIERL